MQSVDSKLTGSLWELYLRGAEVTMDENAARALKLVLREAWTTALERWPELEAYQPHFCARIADIAGTEQAATEVIPKLRAEDLLLATAALAGSSFAKTKVDALIRSTIQPTLRRYLRSDDTATKETEQNVVVDVLYGRDDGKRAKLATYSGEGRLTGWLNSVARTTAIEYLEKLGRTEPLEPSEDNNIPFTPPSFSPEAEIYVPRVTAAITRAMDELPPKLRTVLRMSLLEELTIDEIGEFYGVHRATAATWIRNAKAFIISRSQEEFRNADSGAVPASELDSVFRVLAGHVHVSVERLLRDEDSAADEPDSTTKKRSRD